MHLKDYLMREMDRVKELYGMHDKFKQNAICEMSSHIDDHESNQRDIVASKKGSRRQLRGKRLSSGLVQSPYNKRPFALPNDGSMSSSVDLTGRNFSKNLSHQSSGIAKRSSRTAAKLLKSQRTLTQKEPSNKLDEPSHIGSIE